MYTIVTIMSTGQTSALRGKVSHRMLIMVAHKEVTKKLDKTTKINSFNNLPPA